MFSFFIKYSLANFSTGLIFLLILLLINLTILFGQSVNCIDKKTNTWYLGNQAGLSFNTEPPTVLYDGYISIKRIAIISKWGVLQVRGSDKISCSYIWNKRKLDRFIQNFN